MKFKFLFSHGIFGRIKNLDSMKVILLQVGIFLLLPTLSFTQNITLTLKNASLEKAFKEIKGQSGYNFVYTRDQIKRAGTVTLRVNNASIQQVLEQCFANQPLTYTIDEKYIIIKDKVLQKDSVSQPGRNQPSIPDPVRISGKVINEEGDPLAGATVAIVGTTRAIATNDKGEFVFDDVRSEGVSLLISNIGFNNKEVLVKSPYLLITLEFAAKSLEETFIKGYYSTTKKLNTGSVIKVNGEEISKQPVSNPISALQGRVPGLLISQKNGLAGSDLTIRIRGQNSIQQGNDPLFLVDGVPFSSENLDRISGGLNVTSPFNTIDPETIESIEILKDADATAIYGSRGANGVVLITTKKAQMGKMAVIANLKTGWGKITRTMDYLNTRQYLAMRREAFKNDNIIPTPANAPDLFLWDTTRYTNWKKKFIGNTALFTNLNTGISGGAKEINYSLNAGYYSEGNVFPGNNNYKRGTANLSLSNVSPKGKFSIVFSSHYTIDNNSLPPQDLTAFISAPPNLYHPYDLNGNLQWSEGGYSYGNAFSYTLQKYNATSERLISTVNLNAKITSRLSLRTRLSYNSIQFDQYSLRPIVSQDPEYNPLGSSSFNYTNSKTWNVEPQIDYNTTLFPKGSFHFLLGSSFQQMKNNGIYLYGDGYTNDAQIGSISGATSVTAQNDFTLYKFSSLFTRLNYSWSNKYLLNIVARQDASSRFGPGNRSANFAAVGVAWIFSEEMFTNRILPGLNLGKIRFSYGTTGNDRIGDYQYLDSWSNTWFSFQGQLGLQPLRLFNDNYSWEQIRKIDVGMELSFLKNRIELNVDYFKHRSINQLISYSLPDQTGFTSIIRNIPAVIQNMGLESSIHSVNIQKGKFSWKSNFNITIQRNKLLEFSELENSNYANRYILGKPVNGILIGFTYLGVDPKTGIYQFEDKNKDGLLNNLDHSFQGSANPDFFGGLENILKYKQVQFSFLVEFRKQMGRHAIFGGYTLPGEFNNLPTAILDRWQKPGDITTYQQFTQAYGRPIASASSRKANSSAALTDASFARLKSLAIYYTLPNKISKRIMAETFQLYVQGQNLITVTKYIGADPETQNLQTLPPLKVFNVGLNLKF